MSYGYELEFSVEYRMTYWMSFHTELMQITFKNFHLIRSSFSQHQFIRMKFENPRNTNIHRSHLGDLLESFHWSKVGLRMTHCIEQMHCISFIGPIYDDRTRLNSSLIIAEIYRTIFSCNFFTYKNALDLTTKGKIPITSLLPKLWPIETWETPSGF